MSTKILIATLIECIMSLFKSKHSSLKYKTQSAINVNDVNAIIVLSIASNLLLLHSLIIFIFFDNVVNLRSIYFFS